MSEIKILDLPELPVQDQDYTLVVKPDGTHVKIKLGDLPGTSLNDTLVNTYAEALALFTGDKKRTIFIAQQSQYNEPFEFFTWIPVVQKAYYLGIDPNYLD